MVKEYMKYLFYLGLSVLFFSSIFLYYEMHAVGVNEKKHKLDVVEKEKISEENSKKEPVEIHETYKLKSDLDVVQVIRSPDELIDMDLEANKYAVVSPAIESSTPVVVEDEEMMSYENTMSVAIYPELSADDDYENSHMAKTAAIESDMPATPVHGFTMKINNSMPAIESEMPVYID